MQNIKTLKRNGNELILNGKRFILMKNLIDRIRYLVLKLALPKKQYYIQADGFHSVFHPILSDVMRIDYEPEISDQNDNG